MGCPTETQLNELVEQRLPAVRAKALAAHLRDCARCQAIYQALVAATAALSQLESASGDSPHPALADLAALREGRLSGPERARVLTHLSLCPECAYVVGRLPGKQPTRTSGRIAPSLIRFWQPLAAAASVLLVVGLLAHFTLEHRLAGGLSPESAPIGLPRLSAGAPQRDRQSLPPSETPPGLSPSVSPLHQAGPADKSVSSLPRPMASAIPQALQLTASAKASSRRPARKLSRAPAQPAPAARLASPQRSGILSPEASTLMLASKAIPAAPEERTHLAPQGLAASPILQSPSSQPAQATERSLPAIAPDFASPQGAEANPSPPESNRLLSSAPEMSNSRRSLVSRTKPSTLPARSTRPSVSKMIAPSAGKASPARALGPQPPISLAPQGLLPEEASSPTPPDTASPPINAIQAEIFRVLSVQNNAAAKDALKSRQ